MALQNDPLRILVVDDNQEAADLLAEVFSMHGHVATAAYGGAQGLSAMIDLAPDVVFLDLGMPGMDGYQVTQRLRAMREVRQPFLIAFTAWNDEASKARVVAAGFDLHMTKPAKFDALLEALDTLRPVVRLAS